MKYCTSANNSDGDSSRGCKSWISLVDHCVAKENKSGESNNGLKLQVNRFGLIKTESVKALTCITTVLINKVGHEVK